MTLKDEIKKLVVDELRLTPQLAGSARIGFVQTVNPDGSVDVMVDGSIVKTSSKYNAGMVQGMEAVVIFDDRGGVISAPTRPIPETVQLERKEFFTAIGFLRFAIDETFNTGLPPNIPIFRFQDQGSSKLYRLSVSDINGSTIFEQNFNLSPNGKFFSFSVTISGSTSQTDKIFIRAYDLGAVLKSAGTINDSLQLFTLQTTLIQGIELDNIKLTFNNPIDTFIEDDKALYWLESFDPNGPQPGGTGCPTPPPDYKRIFTSAGVGTNANSDTYQTPPFPAGITETTTVDQSWLSVSPSTVVGPAVSPTLYTITYSTSGLLGGSYSATITITDTDSFGGVIINHIQVCITIYGIVRRQFRIWKGSTLQATMEVPRDSIQGLVYLDFNTRILNAKKNHIASKNIVTGKLDVLDITGGSSAPIASFDAPATLTFQTRDSSYYSQCFSSAIPSLADRVLREDKGGNLDLISYTNDVLADFGGAFVPSILFGGTGFVVDAHNVVRKVKIAAPNATADALPGISGISPGESNDTKIRQIPTDGGQPFLASLGFVS